MDPEQLLKTLLSAEIVNSLLAGVLGVFAMGWLLFGLEVWRNPAISNIDQAVYLAVVTLTTVGFGGARRRCLLLASHPPHPGSPSGPLPPRRTN